MYFTKHFQQRIKDRNFDNINWNDVVQNGKKFSGKNNNYIEIHYNRVISKNREQIIKVIYNEKEDILITAFVKNLIDKKRSIKKQNFYKKKRRGKFLILEKENKKLNFWMEEN